ncbi:MFS transporter [Burkholderia multivorans]|uniref:MFS transporter n=1 Tax=Burkholderia multivorans TaxID=87883 RepID=UPI001C219CC3|nr:MFS transporter [Burkholderia multivorans]MBU9223470.1 MFS transporter [Burkholderia multivorans]MBU9418076.1 MFS transporter [Burkholderia multivorans]MBU9478767.1 MFS transporter [Burkholderia multivorans]
MSTGPTASADRLRAPEKTALDVLYGKVTVRLLTLFFFCFFAAYLDRVNIGLAKLQMLDALAFSDRIYGLGAGLFFVGYIAFEIPSNLVLEKVGARIWIARVMITWGLLSGATLLVKTPLQFYIVRFLLGAAEAGFVPGVLLYLSQWFPYERRARIVALFMIGIPISSLVGNPLSGWLMNVTDGLLGFGGWQWLFLLEALPSVALGVFVLFWLPNTIEQASWLGADEKRMLLANLDSHPHVEKMSSLRHVFIDRRLWILGLIDACIMIGVYATSFWLPSILRDTGVRDPFVIGLWMTLPNAAAVISMLWCGRSSDRWRERRWHMALPCLVAGFGLFVAATMPHATLATVVLFSLINAGAAATIPVIWTLPPTFLKGSGAAAGIAMITSLANLGGLMGTYLLGWVKDAFDSQQLALFGFGMCMLIGCALALAYPKPDDGQGDSGCDGC